MGSGKSYPLDGFDRIAGAIDLGSNAIRILICIIKSSGAITQLHKQRFAVRLGRSVFAHGQLDEPTMLLALDVMQQCAQLCREHRVTHAKAVGTSALRDAKNASTFCSLAQQALGFPLEIIDGNQEASLTLHAVLAALPELRVKTVIDLGGGSLEISHRHMQDEWQSVSLNLGTVRLLHEFDLRRALNDAKLKELYAHLQQLLSTYAPKPQLVLSPAVAAGGNANVLADLLDTETPAPSITRKQLVTHRKRLLQTSVEKRMALFGINYERAEVIGAATAVYESLCKYYDWSEIHVAQASLRDALCLQAPAVSVATGK